VDLGIIGDRRVIASPTRPGSRGEGKRKKSLDNFNKWVAG